MSSPEMPNQNESESPRDKLTGALGVGRDATDKEMVEAFYNLKTYGERDTDAQAYLEKDMEDVLDADWESRLGNKKS